MRINKEINKSCSESQKGCTGCFLVIMFALILFMIICIFESA